MWKYITKEQCNEFLLSLDLIDEKLVDKAKIKKLYTISNSPTKNYKIFRIKKKNGQFRTIYEPSYTLKHIQRQILTNILENKKISPYAKAYHKNISLKDNAILHLKKEFILKLDIKDFFDSISFFDIYNSCFPIEYFPKPVGMLLTYLCTYNEHLPQGAPTSAYISNLVLKEFDEELGKWCCQNNISYTRYSDDMTFSGMTFSNELIPRVRKMLSKLGLELNNKKTHLIHHSNRQIVTGIIVNEKCTLDKNYKKKIRQEMYYLTKYGIDSHCSKINCQDKLHYLASLKGKILYVLQIDQNNQEFINYKNTINKLIQK